MAYWLKCVKAGAKMALDPKLEVYHDHPMISLKGSWLRSFYYARNHIILLRAAFGRNRWPHYQRFPYSFFTFEEFLLVRGVLVWKQQRVKADELHVNPGLLKFLFLRLFGSRIPNMLGWTFGMFHPIGKVADPQITNAHEYGKAT